MKFSSLMVDMPEIKFCDDSVTLIKYKTVAYTNHLGNESTLENGVEFQFPGKISLVWYPWPSHLPKPPRDPGQYRPFHGKLMPRRTKCYGYAYAFSGQVHPVEKEFPESIMNICRECELIFGYEQGKLNMCLENDYDNGNESIGAHSDDERQFGSLKDVICAVTGPAKRSLIIKAVAGGKKMLEVLMPSGIYAMCGRAFQKLYTHEFPKLYPDFYKKVRDLAMTEWAVDEQAKDERSDLSQDKKRKAQEMEWPSNLTDLQQSQWLKAHSTQVKTLLKTQTDRRKWDEWCKHRTSYTLRNFSN